MLDFENPVTAAGRFLCKLGLHRYRTNECGFTYRCTRPGCRAMYQDAAVGRAITRALSYDSKKCGR